MFGEKYIFERYLECTIVKFNEVLVASAKQSIPRAKFKPHLKPYWSESLKQLHYEIRQCHREWIAVGRPRNRDNMFFFRYKEAKRKFRKELRQKAWEHEVSEQNELQRIFEVDRGEFHKRICKLRSAKIRTGNVLKIEGKLVSDKEQVLGIWRDHCEKLYSPLECENFDEDFKKLVEQKVQEYSTLSHEVTDDPLDTQFQVDEVANVCRSLPNGKAGGLDGIQYEHLKYGGDSCWESLTRILNSIRELEILPESMTTGMIISLFKGKKKSKFDKDSYRGITLLNVIGKILERIILERNLVVLNEAGVPNKVQFAYQESNSCIMASFALQEVINYYKEEGSNVFSCFLDSSKAFDTVWIDGLFFKLFNMGVKGKTWRILRNWYSKMSCCILMDGHLSEPFSVKQGIRQGGVLSPWLYMCFNNDITEMLDNLKCGIEIESLDNISNITIADDITLISPRVSGLQAMIHAMEKYGNRWRFMFNLSKTAVVTFGESTICNSRNRMKRTFYMYNKPIEEKQFYEHAGIILSCDFSSSKRTKGVVNKGKEVVSSLMSAGIRPGGLNPICSVEI